MSIALVAILSFLLLATLDVTAGQPGAAGAGPYDLCGGLSCAAIAYHVFLPLVLWDA
jgi:hypothetical protein